MRGIRGERTGRKGQGVGEDPCGGRRGGHLSGELEEGVGDDLEDEAGAVREDEGEEGAHHCRLARPHDHLRKIGWGLGGRRGGGGDSDAGGPQTQ